MASIQIGRLGRPHGLNGHLLLDDCPLTADELTALHEVTWRNLNGDERTLVVESVRPMLARLIVQFAGLTRREQARELTLGGLFTDSGRLPDPGPGVAYAFQLIGLAVETVDGVRLGLLDSIISTGAHPVYVVQGEREWLVPANPEVLKRVDLERGVITVALPAGLEDI